MNAFKIIIILLLFSISPLSHSEELVCFVANQISFDKDATKLDIMTSKKKHKKLLSSYIFFDFNKMETSFFDKDKNGKKVRILEKIFKIGPSLFYSVRNEYYHKFYSTYLFGVDMKKGILSEDGYVSIFECTRQTEKEFRRQYNL